MYEKEECLHTHVLLGQVWPVSFVLLGRVPGVCVFAR